MQTNESGKVLLGVIELTEAKRIRSALLSKGVGLEFLHNPETCAAKNCKPSVEVYVDPGNAEAVMEFLRAERATLLEGLGDMIKHAGEVFDTAKGQATCPACGTSFSTTAKECPDCGLVFMSDEMEG